MVPTKGPHYFDNANPFAAICKRVFTEIKHMTNMNLEDILQELSKYGRPTVNQYAASATPGIKTGGTWGCEVSIPSKWPEGEDKGTPVTGWRMWGIGATPTEAAVSCLDQCMALAESELASYAKFVSTDQVKGK